MAAATLPQVRGIVYNSTILEVLLFGIYTCLALFTSYMLLEDRRTRIASRERFIIFGLLFLSYSCSAIHALLTWWFTAGLYTNFGGTDFIAHLHLQPAWFIGVGTFVFCLSTIIADGISIWRCWVLWGRRLYLVILPIMAVTTGFVLCMLALKIHIDLGASTSVAQSLILNARYESIFTPYIALSLSSTAYTTLLIVTRMLLLYREINRDIYIQSSQGGGGGGSSSLPSIGTDQTLKRAGVIIVESAFLYLIVHTITMPLLTTGSLSYVYASNLLPQMAGIAPTLIILRVSLGYTDPTSYRNDLSPAHHSGGQGRGTLPLRFATMPSTVTDHSGSTRSGVEHKDEVSEKLEA